MNGMKISCRWPLAVLVLLAACGPSEQQKAQFAEQKRIECLDKFCDGDVEPKHDMLNEVAFKLNGQWFIGPEQYGNPNFGAIAFYWPSKAASGDAVAFSKAQEIIRNKVGGVDNFYDIAIEIFLTGRQRWPTPEVKKPWENTSWQSHLDELLANGLRMDRVALNTRLDVVRFYERDGTPYRYVYYVAVGLQRIRGSGPPVLSCQVSAPPHPDDRCTSGEFWKPDVYADFRFNARHAVDWPGIHEEIVRVLKLARDAQP